MRGKTHIRCNTCGVPEPNGMMDAAGNAETDGTAK
jgi:hypothetical protein